MANRSHSETNQLEDCRSYNGIVCNGTKYIFFVSTKNGDAVLPKECTDGDVFLGTHMKCRIRPRVNVAKWEAQYDVVDYYALPSEPPGYSLIGVENRSVVLSCPAQFFEMSKKKTIVLFNDEIPEIFDLDGVVESYCIQHRIDPREASFSKIIIKRMRLKRGERLGGWVVRQVITEDGESMKGRVKGNSGEVEKKTKRESTRREENNRDIEKQRRSQEMGVEDGVRVGLDTREGNREVERKTKRESTRRGEDEKDVDEGKRQKKMDIEIGKRMNGRLEKREDTEKERKQETTMKRKDAERRRETEKDAKRDCTIRREDGRHAEKERVQESMRTGESRRRPFGYERKEESMGRGEGYRVGTVEPEPPRTVEKTIDLCTPLSPSPSVYSNPVKLVRIVRDRKEQSGSVTGSSDNGVRVDGSELNKLKTAFHLLKVQLQDKELRTFAISERPEWYQKALECLLRGDD